MAVQTLSTIVVKDGSLATITRYEVAPGTGFHVNSGLRPSSAPAAGAR
jgi:hypothetical protein